MDLSQRAMLVTLSISKWDGRRFDRAASDALTAQAGAETGAARVNKLLVPKETLAPVQQAADALRAEHYRLTLPWSDDGARILAAPGFWRYRDAVAVKTAAFNLAVDRFLDAYQDVRRDAPAQLGALYRDDDYPEAWQLREKFRASWHPTPLPSGADFRVELGDDQRAALAAEIETRTRATAQAAIGDAWARARRTLEHLASRLDALREHAAADADGKAPRLYESTLQNVVDLADLLPCLNISGDPELDRVAAEMRARFSSYTTDALKTSETARSAAVRDVNDILAAFGGGSPLFIAAE